MAANAIGFDKSTDLGRSIARALQMIREGSEVLAHARAQFIQLRDGDGSLASHYDLAATKGGYVANDYADSNAAAKASFDEVDSLYSKICTDAATSAVNAAILQANAKHGI